MKLLAATAVVCLLTGATFAADAPDPAAAAPDPVFTLDDSGFDAQFQCPDTLADADARLDEIARYVAWAKLHHPDWNLKKRLDVRYGLLRRHACAMTLANIAASTRPPFAP